MVRVNTTCLMYINNYIYLDLLGLTYHIFRISCYGSTKSPTDQHKYYYYWTYQDVFGSIGLLQIHHMLSKIILMRDETPVQSVISVLHFRNRSTQVCELYV